MDFTPAGELVPRLPAGIRNAQSFDELVGLQITEAFPNEALADVARFLLRATGPGRLRSIALERLYDAQKELSGE